MVEIRNLQQLKMFFHELKDDLNDLIRMVENNYIVDPIYKKILEKNTALSVLKSSIEIEDSRIREQLDDIASNIDTIYRLLDDKISEEPAFQSMRMDENEEIKMELLNLLNITLGKVGGLLNAIDVILKIFRDENIEYLVTDRTVVTQSRGGAREVVPEATTVTRVYPRTIELKNYSFEISYMGETKRFDNVAAFLLGRGEYDNRLVVYELDLKTYDQLVGLISNLQMEMLPERKREYVRRHIKGELYTFSGSVGRTMSREHLIGFLSEKDSVSIILFDIAKNSTTLRFDSTTTSLPGQRSGKSVLVPGYVEIMVRGLNSPIVIKRIR